MILDLQKASMWKRISAWLFDSILLCTLVVAFALLLSAVLGVDGHIQTMNQRYSVYEAQFGIEFDVTVEQYNAMSEQELAIYEAAYAALTADTEAVHAYNMVISLVLVILSGSILLGYLVLEFFVPLTFGNGQTLGKKVFGIGLMRIDGVKMTNFALFVRTVLGKYTIETMAPLLIALMMLFGSIGMLGPVLILALGVIQLILLITSHTNSLIHDQMACTVVVDMASQMIFPSAEALLEYKKQRHAEETSADVY